MKKQFAKFITLVVSCIFLLSCAGNEKVLTQKILLSQDWKVQSSAKTDQNGEQLSTSAAITEGWYTATVPSTIMGVLSANGLYKDLLLGTNYKNADRTPFDVSWWYRTTFKLSDIGKDKHIELQFDGLTYRANIWLNGKQIASKDDVYGPFSRFSFDITQYANEENTLAVEVFRAQKGEPNIGFVDWNPRPLDENMGIFREVRLVITGNVSMANTWVYTKVDTTSLNEAWINIETQLSNLSDKDVNGELKGKIENIDFSLPVTLKAGEKKKVKITPEDIASLHIKNPRLWWCNHLGSPELYDLNLKFIADNKVSSQEDVTFGIRQIDTYITPDGHKGFILNGKKVLIKSAGWTDDIFLRDTPESNEIQIQYVKDMNLNSIRFENIWGSSQNIYDLCDRYGLLALVGWSCQWEWENYYGAPDDEFGCVRTEHDIDLLARFFNDQIVWLRNHPGIIAWMVGSDKLPRPELEKKYLDILPQIDNRPYIGAAKTMVSKLSGPTGMKMNGPYEYVGPNYWYIDTLYGGAFGFNTETGPGSQIPVYESIRKTIPEDDLWPLNEAWDFHCTTSTTALNSMAVTTAAVTGKFGKANDLKSYLDRAHLLNYESTKSMFEAFRVNKTEGTGIVQWMLNSAWPSMYWQLYDYFMIPTPAYYGVKRGNLPNQLIYDYKDNGIYAVNESSENLNNLKAIVRGYSADSKVLYEKEITFSIKSNEAQKVHTIVTPTGSSFLHMALYNSQNKQIAENFYTLSSIPDSYYWEKTDWVGTPIKSYSNFTALASMPKSELKINVSKHGKDANSSIAIEIENPTSSIAFFTQFLLKDATGEIIYPVYWEDNYISILPGEKRTLKCNFDENTLKSKIATLKLTGWNLDEQSVQIN